MRWLFVNSSNFEVEKVDSQSNHSFSGGWRGICENTLWKERRTLECGETLVLCKHCPFGFFKCTSRGLYARTEICPIAQPERHHILPSSVKGHNLPELEACPGRPWPCSLLAFAFWSLERVLPQWTYSSLSLWKWPDRHAHFPDKKTSHSLPAQEGKSPFAVMK